MTGALEMILTKRYGDPVVVPSEPFLELRWNACNDVNACVLYKKLVWDKDPVKRWHALEPIYGDSVGGLLMGIPSSIKVAMIRDPKVFGLYRLDELQARPEVQNANSLDPAVCFFMDSANVWFYGLKDDELFVFDSATDELGSLGSFASGLEQLLAEWEQAKASRR